ncbi:hypothetical protein NXF25_006981 [Crotalus adamanteus]|uniref:Uncharacterized protein n=1 Tax=Crotalus adamanteus TaxID=8729 RepID=A0AAW1C372_CROAD
MNERHFSLPGAWIQTDFPSSSQVPEKGLTNNVKSKSQSNIISCISLPGSVTDDIDEVQAHSSKNTVMDEEIGHGKKGQSLHMLLGLQFLELCLQGMNNFNSSDKDNFEEDVALYLNFSAAILARHQC